MDFIPADDPTINDPNTYTPAGSENIKGTDSSTLGGASVGINQPTNSVWNTIQGNLGTWGSQALNVFRDVTVAGKTNQTTAKPDPQKSASTPFNPFPGLFSSYPQSDAKGNPIPATISPNMLIIGAILLVVVLIFVRR